MARSEHWKWLAIVPLLASGCAERIMAPVMKEAKVHFEAEMREALALHAISCLIARGLSGYLPEDLFGLEGRTVGLKDSAAIADAASDVSLIGWGLPNEHIAYDAPQLRITPSEAASWLAESRDELKSLVPSRKAHRYAFYFSSGRSPDVIVLQAASRITADAVVEMRIERTYRLAADRINWK